ncbi:MAG: tetratricopeptide repeat protein, partial [Crocosphaera sp.]
MRAEARHADAYNSLGFIYSRQGQLEEAIRYYEGALQIRPNYAQAHLNLGMTLLQQGEFQRGWVESEWRWQTEQFTPFSPPHPLWEGQPLPDQTLLIHTEQGAGDAIQFSRYLPLVAERCRRIILVSTPNLIPLFQGIEGISEIRTPGEIAIKNFDTYIPLMSLPKVFDTRLDTIPQQVPYLKAPTAGREALAAAIKQRRAPDSLQVGIVWAGSPTHGNDRHRSCALVDFLPVLQVPEVQFY